MRSVRIVFAPTGSELPISAMIIPKTLFRAALTNVKFVRSVKNPAKIDAGWRQHYHPSELKCFRLHCVQLVCAAIAALADSSLKASRFCTLVTPYASKIYNSKTGES